MGENTLVDDEIKELQLIINSQQLETKKKIEIIQALRVELERQSEYKELYDFSPLMYLIIDTYYKIDSLNFSAASFLGRERVFLLNKSFLKLIAGSSKALFRRTIQSLLNMGFKQTCEIELLLKGGERKYIQLECTLNRDKRIHLCLSDITDLHQKKVLFLVWSKI